MVKENNFYQGIYRDPKTGKLIVRVFSFKSIAGIKTTDNAYISHIMRVMEEEFNIAISMKPIGSCYYHGDVDNPLVAYTNIEDIIRLTENGDELDMSCFDDVAIEFAYNEDYQKFIFHEFINTEYDNKETIAKVYNYISDKAISEINYHLEMVTNNWKAWKDNPYNKNSQ